MENYLDRKYLYQLLNEVKLIKRFKNLIAPNFINKVSVVDDKIEIYLEINYTSLQKKQELELEITKLVSKKCKLNKDKIKITFISQKVSKKDNPLEEVKNIIVIASGKGGVGKSTVSVNIAGHLSKIGYKVGILDADIYGPSIPTMLNIENEKLQTEQIGGDIKLCPIENYNLKILSIGFFIDMSQPVIWRGAMANKAISQMIYDTKWGELDFMIVDLPPGTGDIHLSIIELLQVTGAIIVSTPQKIALIDTHKAVSMFKNENINIPILGIVENMSYFLSDDNKKHYIFDKDGAEILAEDLEIVFLGKIPLIQKIRERSDVGRPISLDDNSKIFENIVNNIIKNLKKNYS